MGKFFDDRVFKLLSEIYNENDWARICLEPAIGEIYCYGLGVPQDIAKGMKYFDKFPDHPRVIENKKHFKKTLFGWKMV